MYIIKFEYVGCEHIYNLLVTLTSPLIMDTKNGVIFRFVHVEVLRPFGCRGVFNGV